MRRLSSVVRPNLERWLTPLFVLIAITGFLAVWLGDSHRSNTHFFIWVAAWCRALPEQPHATA